METLILQVILRDDVVAKILRLIYAECQKHRKSKLDQQAETTSSSGSDEDCPVSDQWFNIDHLVILAVADSENTLHFKAVSEDHNY